jgi:transposase
MALSRTDLTEKQWRQLERHLTHNRHRGHAYVKHRRVIDGILWCLRTGACWGGIPRGYGPWQTCYDRVARWSRTDTWEHLVKVMQKAVDEAGLVDSDGTAIQPTEIRHGK